ncbi:serine/threonine-protein kinase, partial [Ideonella sp.]|uniref:serine/threonine-protein kinase n=1 Tax=Ideonella sp. TaxID=1929293 RepID=UPI003BB4F274
MNTSPPDWPALKRVFEQAVDLDPAQREAVLQAAQLDPAGLAEVRSLLAHHDDATRGQVFMAASAAAQWAAEADEPGSAARIGQRLGAWEIVSAVGAGGMGEVFEARRADGQFDGRAAVKLLRRGMNSAAVLQRFALERQALARLSHPHIARLLDAGASEDGLPYFVLEFVDGQPIDQAVRGLTLDARLRLFLQLADAVAHAHRNLLVHRDLKPGNVLVDGQGQVKLLDFGIAKALDPLEDLESSDGNTTVGGVRPYTPNYASPEQVRGEPVSTATDIYSLGVLLYQMLTGTRPTGRNATTPAEAARSVLEDEPTRPSRLSATEAVDPHWLQTRKKLEGDLDNILLKALEKAPERRYASVDALQADVGAFLSGYPVSARSASKTYLLSKFVARNRAAVAASVAALLALVGGLGLTAWQAEQARLARDEAQARLVDIRNITRDLVFRFGDSVSYLPGGMKVKEELLQDALRSLDRLAQGRDRDPALLADVANTYARLAELQGSDQSLSLGKPDAARENAQKAVALATPLLPDRRKDWRLHQWTARAHVVLAQVERGRGQPALALAELQLATAVLADVDLADADELGRAQVLGQRGATLVTQAQLQDQLAVQNGTTIQPGLATYAEAEQVYRGLAAERAMLERIDLTGRPEEPRSYAQVLTQLAVVQGGRSRLHHRLDQLDEALKATEAAMALSREAVAYDPSTQLWKDALANESNNLAVVRLKRGEGTEALAATQETRMLARALIQAEGPQSRWAQWWPRLLPQYGRALAMTGQPSAALPVLAEALVFADAQAASAPAGAAGHAARRSAAWLHVQHA